MVEPLLVSVALCTYNGERYLREQLASIAGQSVLPAELVIGDDGSTDRTLEMIEAFAAVAPFPVTIHVNDQNLGVAMNFVATIRRCRYDWVMLCDQDDIWLPHRMTLFVQDLQANPGNRVFLSDAQLADESGTPLHQTLFSAYRLTHGEIGWINRGQAERALAKHVFATGAGMMVNRSWAITRPDPSAGILHDEWYAWLASPFVRVIDQPTFLYRQHRSQLTGIDGRLTAQFSRFLRPKPALTLTIGQGVQRFTALLHAVKSQPEAEGLAGQPASSRAISVLSDKVAFLTKRSQLKGCLARRIIDILCQVGPDAYLRYGSGLRTLLKDLTGKDSL